MQEFDVTTNKIIQIQNLYNPNCINKKNNNIKIFKVYVLIFRVLRYIFYLFFIKKLLAEKILQKKVNLKMYLNKA